MFDLVWIIARLLETIFESNLIDKPRQIEEQEKPEENLDQEKEEPCWEDLIEDEEPEKRKH